MMTDEDDDGNDDEDDDDPGIHRHIQEESHNEAANVAIAAVTLP